MEPKQYKLEIDYKSWTCGDGCCSDSWSEIVITDLITNEIIFDGNLIHYENCGYDESEILDDLSARVNVDLNLHNCVFA